MNNYEELILEVKQLIANNRTEKALELLAQAQLSDLDKDLIILNSRYSKVKEDQRLGVIDEDLAQRRLNTINRDLLELSERVRSKKVKKVSSVTPLKKVRSFNKMWIIPIVSLLIILTLIGIWAKSNAEHRSKCDKEWNKCLNEGKVEKYKSFIELADCITVERRRMAKDSIKVIQEREQLVNKEKEDRCNKQWNICLKGGDADCYKKFLASECINDSLKRIAEDSIKSIKKRVPPPPPENIIVLSTETGYFNVTHDGKFTTEPKIFPGCKWSKEEQGQGLFALKNLGGDVSDGDGKYLNVTYDGKLTLEDKIYSGCKWEIKSTDNNKFLLINRGDPDFDGHYLNITYDGKLSIESKIFPGCNFTID